MRDKFGLVVDHKADTTHDFLNDDLRAFAFTAVRELLMNVTKHAGVKAASICVHTHGADRIAIEVRDKGKGFDAKANSSGGQKFGLFSIQERAESLGGRLDVVSRPGGGTCVTLTLPIR
jgi:signal transduction histidine kinase